MKKLKFYVSLIVAVLGMGIAPHLRANPIIDQNQPNATNLFGFAFSGDTWWQTFQQSGTNISGAGVFVSAADIVTISIWNGVPNYGGTRIATGSDSSTGSGWIDIFWDAVSVVPGSTLYLSVNSSNPTGLAFQSPYASGSLGFGDGTNSMYNAVDMAFRTYTTPAQLAVPESGMTAVMLGGAILGLAALRRRLLC